MRDDVGDTPVVRMMALIVLIVCVAAVATWLGTPPKIAAVLCVAALFIVVIINLFLAVGDYIEGVDDYIDEAVGMGIRPTPSLHDDLRQAPSWPFWPVVLGISAIALGVLGAVLTINLF